MNDIILTGLLAAFANRLSADHLDAIAKAQRDCEYAALNYGMSSQIDRQKAMSKAVASAVDSLKQHDKDILSQIIGRLTQ